MKLEFEFRHSGQSKNFMQYDVLRKGLVVGFMSIDKTKDVPSLSMVTMEEK